jgi:hypothetical protein
MLPNGHDCVLLLGGRLLRLASTDLFLKALQRTRCLLTPLLDKFLHLVELGVQILTRDRLQEGIYGDAQRDECQISARSAIPVCPC